MVAATDPNVKRLTIMSCTQLLKTELLNNIVGYHMANDPCPMIYMMPTVSLAQSWSKDRLEPMLRDTKVLRRVVKEKKSRDSNNTILHKIFPGGQLTMIGANSPSELASRPVRLILCDEVDRYPESAGKEGDPISLVWERAATFFDRKLIVCSTPTIQGRSRIELEYEQSDKRVFCAPCHHCGEADELTFDNVKWDDDDPETTRYVCPHCDGHWTDTDRVRNIQKGFYRATAPFTGHAGFKVNKLGSPWEPMSTLVAKFLEAKPHPEKLKSFVNTQLAETWVEKGEAPDSQRLYERRELWHANTLEKGVVFLTAGADVQKDRIEVEIVGWGRDKQSWSVDYRVIMGDTVTSAPWLELDKVLNEVWRTHDGRELSLRMLAVDTGYNTQHVYNWVRTKPADRVRAIKGFDSQQTITGTPRDVDVNRDGTKTRRGAKLWPVGVSVVKQELYAWLKLDKPEDGQPFPPGYCHFPEYDLEHFKRLCSEQLMMKRVRGKPVYQWTQVHERNEQLDCRVYARAAANMFGIDRLQSTEWDMLEGKHDLPGQAKKQVVEERKQTNSERNSGFWTDRDRIGWNRE